MSDSLLIASPTNSLTNISGSELKVFPRDVFNIKKNKNNL